MRVDETERVTDPIPRSPWRFYTYLAGQTVSNVGDQLQGLAMGLLVIQLTGSPLYTGILAAAGTLPNLLLALLAGTLADRAHRLRLMGVAELGRGLLVLAVPLLAYLGSLEVWHLFVLAFLMASLNALGDAAAPTLLPELVDRERLGSANGYLYMAQSGSGVVGPALAGAIVAAVGLIESLVFTGGSYVFSVIALLVVAWRTRIGAPLAGRPKASFWTDLTEGLRYSVAQPVLRTIALMMLIVNFAFTATMGVFLFHATAVLGIGAAEVGIVFAAGSASGLIGALFASRIGARLGRGRTAVLGNVLGATGVALVAVAQTLPLLILGFVIVGLNGPMVNVNTATIRQLTVPPRLLGRVFAFARFGAWAANPAGAVVGGIVAASLGTTLVFQATAVLMLVAAAVGWAGGLRRA